MIELVLTAALIAETFAFVWYLDRSSKRTDAERQTLLQRIQAPEVAVMQHATETAGPDETAPVDEFELDPEEKEAIELMEQLERRAAPWLS